eukprot:1085455-Pelagomonas_calceolata.AAC.5
MQTGMAGSKEIKDADGCDELGNSAVPLSEMSYTLCELKQPKLRAQGSVWKTQQETCVIQARRICSCLAGLHKRAEMQEENHAHMYDRVPANVFCPASASTARPSSRGKSRGTF